MPEYRVTLHAHVHRTLTVTADSSREAARLAVEQAEKRATPKPRAWSPARVALIIGGSHA